jgi:hypothetical protein
MSFFFSARTVSRRIDDIGDFTLSCLKTQISVFHEIFIGSWWKHWYLWHCSVTYIRPRNRCRVWNNWRISWALELKGNHDWGRYFSETVWNSEKSSLKLEKLCCVTTDGAKSMVRSNSGVVTRIKTEMECSNFSPPMKLHCILHQQALCSKVVNLESVMNIVVSTVNFIRGSALNHRQFQQFLLEIEAE